ASGLAPAEAELASARRFALHLRRLHHLRRHGVLVYVGAWREFRTVVDDARSKAVDPLWSADDLPEHEPTGAIAANGGCFAMNTSSLWGASIVVFVPADGACAALGPALRRCFAAATTSWRAEMMSVALGPS